MTNNYNNTDKIKHQQQVFLIESDDDDNNDNQFQNFNDINHKSHIKKQQQDMIKAKQQNNIQENFDIQVVDSPYYDRSTLLTNNKQQNSFSKDKDMQKQFEQVRFNSLQCNLMDMDIYNQNDKKPHSLLEGYDYQKFIQNRVILVQPPQLINQGYITSYKLYQIKTKPSQTAQFDTCVSRRFSDFQYLNQLLIDKFGGYIIPILPEKNFWTIVNLEGKQYKQVRTKSLNKYLHRLFKHKKLRYCQQLKSFLFQDDAIFSSQKGQHTQKKSHIEEKIKSISSNAFQYGKSLYNKIVNFSTDKQTLKQNEQIRLKKNKVTKQDLTFSEYEIVVGQLRKITKELKQLVQNTLQEMKLIDDLNNLFTSDLGLPFKSSSNHYESMTIKIQNDNFYQEFEQLCEFIESCYCAIERRKALKAQIQSLKQEQENYLERYKNSPRSLQLDIIRSKLTKLKKQNQIYAQQLIKQLELHADESKGMLKRFVSRFQRIKSQFIAESSINFNNSE